MATSQVEPTANDRLDGGLVRVTEAARLLAISRSKTYQMMEKGVLPYVRLGKARRVPLQAIKDLIERNLVSADEAVAAQ